MNKEYQKPEVEIISLTSMEAVSSNDPEGGIIDGDLGLSDSIFD